MKERILEGNTIRDIAVLLFLMTVMAVALMVVLSPAEKLLTYMALMGIAFIAAVFGFFGRTSLCLLLAGTQVSAWTAFKLYNAYTLGEVFILQDFLWLPAPFMLAGAVVLFQYGSSMLERENTLLRSQVEDLVMVDSLTKLNNVRSLYREIPIMARQCARHGQDLSLMIVALRYEVEMRHLLSARRFNELKQRLANIVQGELRLEDKLYAIDEAGSLALLLVTNDAGCEIVKNRIRTAVEDASAFSGIVDDNILVSVRFAHRMCTDTAGRQPIEFKTSVESELIYDV
jgi:GGDEF domain-containing protein